MAKYKIGDVVTIKTREDLERDLLYKKGIGYIDEASGIAFVDAMNKTCGKKKVIKKITTYKRNALYYFGPDPRMDFAFVESFFKEDESPL